MRKKTRIILSALLSATVTLSGISFIDFGQVNAAGTFSIITPTANQLKGAGYVNIDWSDVSGAKQYKVYIDNTQVTTSTVSKCEYYTTEVAMHNLYVKAVLNDNSEVTSETVRFGVSKKGICADNNMAQHLDAKSLNAGWYYNWGTGPNNFTSFAGMDYVPMIWGAGANNSIGTIYNNGYRYLLAYNEPDLGNQSNMSVSTVVGYWPLFTAYDFHLGAPVTAQNPAWTDTTGGKWFINFANSIDMSTVDFIPIHVYAGNYGGVGAANWFLTDIVDKIYNTYHKPIWITEFAPSGWGYNNSYGRQQCYEFMDAVLDGFDSRSYVERYAWFSFDTTDNSNGAASLWTNSTGQLTELGQLYASKGLPEGYDPSGGSGGSGETSTEATSETPTTPTGDYSIAVSTSTALLPDSKTISGTGYSDLIKSTNASISESGHTGNQVAAYAIDENIGSRWETVHEVDPQYLTLDFGANKIIKEVGIIWESASASDYKVQISSNGTNFTDVATYSGGNNTNHRLDTITFNTTVRARYVRVYGTKRSTQYGYSIWDMAIYGSGDTAVNPIESAGVQYNLTNEGIRVIYNVEPTYKGATLVESGNIIAAVHSSAINSTFTAESNITLTNLGAYSKKYASTSAGLSATSYSDSASAKSYVMTFVNNGYTAAGYTQKYIINSYATYSDGTTVYSGIYSFSIYDLASYLYTNRLMPNATQHNRLYNKILKVVNPNTAVVNY